MDFNARISNDTSSKTREGLYSWKPIFFFLCVCVWSLYSSLTCLCQCSTPHLAGFKPAFGPAGM